MILAFSTSSPWSSVALISVDGEVVRSDRRLAPMQASGACLGMILSWPLDKVTLLAADIGPGSFTGVRVGVTLAKTLAFARGVSCIGATSFDLISQTAVVAVPSRKGEYFVREPGLQPIRTDSMPGGSPIGFGPWFPNKEVFPDALAFAGLLAKTAPVRPEDFLPAYLIEPSISVPKKPYAGSKLFPR